MYWRTKQYAFARSGSTTASADEARQGCAAARLSHSETTRLGGGSPTRGTARPPMDETMAGRPPLQPELRAPRAHRWQEPLDRGVRFRQPGKPSGRKRACPTRSCSSVLQHSHKRPSYSRWPSELRARRFWYRPYTFKAQQRFERIGGIPLIVDACWRIGAPPLSPLTPSRVSSRAGSEWNAEAVDLCTAWEGSASF